MEPFNMRVNYLTKQQVDYELRIRDIRTTKKDLSVKKKMLRKLLDKEQIVLKKIEDPDFNFDLEKDAINELVNNIRILIEEFEGPETDSDFIRIKTNLIHLTHRVNRVIISTDSPDLTEYIFNFKEEAKANCLELEALVSEKVQSADHIDITRPLNNSTQLNCSHQLTPQVVHKSVPVYKWDIKYNGDKNSSVKSFLERVEELCESRNVSKSELFSSACDLFTGNALLWYRSQKNSFSDWDTLVNLLLKEFLPVDYDDQLWNEIRSRT